MTYFTEEHIDEFRKCKEDPAYFIENYIKLESGYAYNQPGDAPYQNMTLVLDGINLTNLQREVIDDISSRNVVEKYMDRQSGKTTIGLALIVHVLVFNHEKTVAAISKRHDHAKESLRTIRHMILHLPDWMQPKITVDNKTSLRFDNQNHLLVYSSHSTYGMKGRTINFTFADEINYWERRDYEEFMTGFYPVIASGRYNKLLILSS